MLIMLSAAVIAVFLYILLHETGHLIVMLSAGAVIDDFSILGAHVSSHGGNYTNLSDLFLHLNGMLLPLIVSFASMLVYRSEVKSIFYHAIYYVFSATPTASLLAWVAIPFMYLNGTAPASDGVTNFLFNFSQSASPLFVSAGALCLMAIGVALIVKKRIFADFFRLMKEEKKA